MSWLHIPVLKGLIVGAGGEPTPPGHLTGTWLFLQPAGAQSFPAWPGGLTAHEVACGMRSLSKASPPWLNAKVFKGLWDAPQLKASSVWTCLLIWQAQGWECRLYHHCPGCGNDAQILWSLLSPDVQWMIDRVGRAWAIHQWCRLLLQIQGLKRAPCTGKGLISHLSTGHIS